MPNFSKPKGTGNHVGSDYYNPFYNEVDIATQTELATRAAHYSATRRSGVSDDILEWSYRKMAYGRVSANRVDMGFPGSREMTDSNGNLTLYSSTRNVPRLPLLQSIDVTNDGTIGSLLRGKFNFVYWPELGSNSFNMGYIDDDLFIPGKEVKLAWGWSVTPGSRSRQAFTGIINNFNWSFNADYSINAEVSIVSAASLTLGISGDQVTPQTDPDSQSTDPAGVAMSGINIATIIETDLAGITGSMVMSAAGQTGYVGRDDATNRNQILDYIAIGWPTADANTNTVNIQTHWYTTVSRLVEATNKLLAQFEAAGGAQTFSQLFSVQVDGNTTAHLPHVKSSYPQDVVFPSDPMGFYGNIRPGSWTGNYFGFHPARTWDSGSSSFNISATGSPTRDANLIGIQGILISVNYIKDTYRNYIQENAANIPYRNLTKFLEDILKRINVASGDMYQFAAVLCEDRGRMNPPSGDFHNLSSATRYTVILSIEDTNLSNEHTNVVTAYPFDSDAGRPLIKNISISSKPPAPLAAAAFVKARGGRNSNIDTPVSDTPPPGEPATTLAEMATKEGEFGSNGFNEKWCETYRGLQSRLKKVSTTAGGATAHWLTKAIYPVELSLTIDGVSGFSFGNVITTDLLPSEYKKSGMVFTVTKIDHKIVPHSWETTLHTVCRLDASSTLGTKSQ